MKLILPVWSLQKNMMVRLHWQGRDMRQKHQHNAMQCSVVLVLPMQCSDCTVCLVIYLITHGRPVSDTLLWQGEVPYSVEMTLSDEWWHSLYGWLVSAGTSLLTPDQFLKPSGHTQSSPVGEWRGTHQHVHQVHQVHLEQLCQVSHQQGLSVRDLWNYWGSFQLSVSRHSRPRVGITKQRFTQEKICRLPDGLEFWARRRANVH